MQIKQQFSVNASVDRVWEILGPQFDRVSVWASGVYGSQSRDTGKTLPNAPCSGRICETKIGSFKETITQYDEKRKILSYTAQGDKMPFFVKQMSNTWTTESLGQNKTQVGICMEISLMPIFNLVMGPMMRMQMGGVLKEVGEEMKYFAENGVPHPRKREVQHKLATS